MLFFCPRLKVLLWNIFVKKRNNPLLLKSTLKQLVYCQVFWVEVRRLQDLYGRWCFVTAFTINCHAKKLQYKCNNVNQVFSNMSCNKISTFLCKKVKIFIVVAWLFLIFHFSFSFFIFFLLSLKFLVGLHHFRKESFWGLSYVCRSSRGKTGRGR